MRSAVLFLIVATVHFVLSVVGVVVSLPAAFDTQVGFWAAPGKASLALLSAILLAPLAWAQPFLPVSTGTGYIEIAFVSVLFGAAAVGVVHVWRAVRFPRNQGGNAS